METLREYQVIEILQPSILFIVSSHGGTENVFLKNFTGAILGLVLYGLGYGGYILSSYPNDRGYKLLLVLQWTPHNLGGGPRKRW